MRGRMLIILALVIFIAASSTAIAIDVEYTVRVEGIDSSNSSFAMMNDYAQQCDLSCRFSISDIVIPNGTQSTVFTIINDDKDLYNIYFYSTQKTITVDRSDEVVVEVLDTGGSANNTQPENNTEQPVVVCGESRCDAGCVVCSDKKCHNPDFVCEEKLYLERIVPNSTNIGESQINILLRNAGTVDMNDIFIELSGDGITTLDVTPITQLVSGDKDYVFVKINATKAGDIDLVIKLYINGVLKGKEIGMIKVIEDKAPAEDTQVDPKAVSDKLIELKNRYDSLDNDYQDKKNNDYTLPDSLSDSLKENHGYLVDAQSFILNGEYKKADINLKIAEDGINDINKTLSTAPKKKKTLMDTFKNNLIYIGSIAAAIISILTAISLIKNHINKDKIQALHNKLKEKTIEIQARREAKIELKKEAESKKKGGKKNSKKAKKSGNKKTEAKQSKESKTVNEKKE